MPKKRLLFVFSLIIVAILLMPYQSKKGTFNPLRVVLYPVNMTNDTIHSTGLFIKGAIRKMRLRDEENKQLKQEISRLLMEQQKYREAIIENARLREILSLKEKEKRFVAVAEVIARGNDRWANTLTVNKGRRDGIEKDMAVMTVRGLVGKVLSSSDSYSTVLLLNDISFSAAVRLQESRIEGIISGTGAKACMLKYISHEYEIKENETVLTSGLDLLFPSDIPVGYISKVTKKGVGLFQNIEVTPFQDISMLEEVVIVRR